MLKRGIRGQSRTAFLERAQIESPAEVEGVEN